MQKNILDNFNHDKYILEFKDKKYFIYDLDNTLLFYAIIAETAFPPNDIRLYSNRQKNIELINIKTTQNFNYYKTFTITDSSKGKTIGYAQLSEYKSIFIDQWRILTPEKKDIGYIQEESNFISILRYIISMFIPQRFYIIIEGEKVAFFEQTFNLFSLKMKLDFSLDNKNTLDKKLGVACAILSTIKTKHADIAGPGNN